MQRTYNSIKVTAKVAGIERETFIDYNGSDFVEDENGKICDVAEVAEKRIANAIRKAFKIGSLTSLEIISFERVEETRWMDDEFFRTHSILLSEHLADVESKRAEKAKAKKAEG